MINRVLQRLPESKADLLDGMIQWSDNADTSKWYYLAVQGGYQQPLLRAQGKPARKVDQAPREPRLD